MRTLYSAATGMTRSRKYVMRFPIRIPVHPARARQWRSGTRSFEAPGAVRRVAPSRRAAGAKVANDAQVVFDRRNAGGGAVADEGLEVFDVPIALRTLGQHDRGMFFAIDMARREERRRNAVDGEVMALREIPHPFELIGRSV